MWVKNNFVSLTRPYQKEKGRSVSTIFVFSSKKEHDCQKYKRLSQPPEFLLQGSKQYLIGPRQANLVLIAYASSEGSGEPAHPDPWPL